MLAEDGGISTRRLLRDEWYKTHKQRCKDFRKSCGFEESELPAHNRDITIFEYITKNLAGDEHHKWISGRWAWLLGISDASGVVIELVREDTLVVTATTSGRSMLASLV